MKVMKHLMPKKVKCFEVVYILKVKNTLFCLIVRGVPLTWKLLTGIISKY